MMVNVFGTRAGIRQPMHDRVKELNGAISRNLVQETAVKSLMKLAFAKLQELTPNLVTFSDDSPQPWEAVANSRSQPNGVEIDLFPLIRDFVGHISIPILIGSDLIKQYPTVMDDLWELDNAFPLLAMGIPSWVPISGVKKAAAARGRLIEGIGRLHENLDAVATGEADESLVHRMEDVSPIVRERNRIYREQNFGRLDKGSMDLALLWALSANTNTLTFWVLAYIYTIPGLVSRLRAEIDPTGQARDLSSIPLDRILYESPLLKSTFFETLRIASEPASVRYITRDVSIPTPGSSKPTTLRGGSHITVHGMISQMDESVFPSPTTFQPDRFLSTRKSADDDSEQQSAKYGALRPWGLGQHMCRGRVFAEREVMTIVASLVYYYDVAPASGEWKLPGRKPGSGVNLPTDNMRVVITRRKW